MNWTEAPAFYLWFQFSCSVMSSSLRPMDCSTPLSNTNSWSLLKLVCIKSVMPSSHLIPFSSSCLQSFPGSGSFPRSQFFTSGGHSIGASASVSVLPMNIQDWFLLGLIGLISLQSATLLKYFQYFSGHLHPEVCIPKKNTNPWLFGPIIHPPNPFTCLPMQMQVWSLHQKDSPGGWHGNPLQYSCLENPMDRGTWWVTVHGVAKSWIHWSDLACTHAHVLIWGCGDGKQPLP